jgi:NADH-quinone oxidoreductase subunit N
MNWTLALPEIVLSVCGLAILVFGVLQKKSNPAVLCSILTIAAMIVAGVLVCVAPDGIGYHRVFIGDAFARFIKILTLAGAALSIVLSLDYNRSEGISRFEFPVLVLFATVGTMVMASSANLMTLYVGLELQSLAIYILCAFDRDRLRSAESGLKYFVLGSLASGLLLYGISLVFGFAGTMEYRAVQQALAASAEIPAGLVIGIVFVIVGLAFKISAVPFHMWTPDVYQGAPVPVTTFMGGAPKIAAFALLLRVSMLFGSLAAIQQTSITRLMAYSSIGNMGYALIGLAAATPAGIRGTLIYLATYLFMNTGAFACIVAMRRRGHAVERVSDLAGLARTDPTLALAMAIFMFSMIGVPPLAGFFGKLLVFSAALQAGLPLLVIVGIVSSVIGAVYYLRVVRVMYVDAPLHPFDRRPLSVSLVSAASAVVTGLFIVVLGPLTTAAQAAASVLFR